jgi:hypothetical protein
MLSLRAAPSLAADAVEPLYDPPVGSHWLIDTETSTDSQRPEGQQTSLINTEVSIDEKTADSFRISYVNRGATAEGTAPMLQIMRSAMKALENVTIHATTDLSGKPVRVDNLDEAKTAMRAMVDTLMAPLQDKPQLAAVLNQMMNRMIDVDAGQAASVYLEELPMLARAQNTGMKPGDVRHSTDIAASPLGGGALKSNSAFELRRMRRPASGYLSGPPPMTMPRCRRRRSPSPRNCWRHRVMPPRPTRSKNSSSLWRCRWTSAPFSRLRTA